MKKIALAAALSVSATTAFAGGMNEPMIEPTINPEVIVDDTASSSNGGIVVPLLLLILVAAAVSSS